MISLVIYMMIAIFMLQAKVKWRTKVNCCHQILFHEDKDHRPVIHKDSPFDYKKFDTQLSNDCSLLVFYVNIDSIKQNRLSHPWYPWHWVEFNFYDWNSMKLQTVLIFSVKINFILNMFVKSFQFNYNNNDTSQIQWS